MILKFILHSLGAAPVLRIIANLLCSNYSLDATFSDRRGRPLIINIAILSLQLNGFFDKIGVSQIVPQIFTTGGIIKLTELN